MCGFIRRVTDSPHVKAVLDSIGVETTVAGGDFRPQALLQGLIIEEDNVLQAVDAIWWYELRQRDNRWVPNGDITSFNSRDLSKRRWIEPLNVRRGLVVADAIGESNPIPDSKKKQQFLMQAPAGLILGALYKTWASDAGLIYSASIITRNPHPRFSQYHNKAFPLFLPNNRNFLQLWLSKDVKQHAEIDALLRAPRLFTELSVTQVKTYKSGEALGETRLLAADDLSI